MKRRASGQSGFTIPKRRNKIFLVFVLSLFIAACLTNTEDFFGKEEPKEESFVSDFDFFLSSEREDSSESIIFTDKNTLLSGSAPYFVSSRVMGGAGVSQRNNIISYKVEEGDTLSSVADKFDISKDTIRWANDINGQVKPGEELVILPVTGVMYYVESGDTLSEVAEMHKAEREEIKEFNNLYVEDIYPGDLIIIPGGERPAIPEPAPPAPSTQFVAPAIGIVTQGPHHYNAIDIANNCGSPIYAVQSGVVVERAYNTWPAGHFLKIDHGNVVAMYAHMQNMYVGVGDRVHQGQQVGTMGTTGLSTGCHIHFDILSRRIRNPFAHIPVGGQVR